VSEHRAKPLNAKTRESLKVALESIHDDAVYLNDALKQKLSPSLKERFETKRDHLVRAGTWIESKLASTED
jgi:hypothetical protein